MALPPQESDKPGPSSKGKHFGGPGFGGTEAHAHKGKPCVICNIPRTEQGFFGRACSDCIGKIRKTYGHQSWQRVDAAGRISVAKEVLEARKRAMTDEDVALTRTARKIAKVLVPLLDQAKNA